MSYQERKNFKQAVENLLPSTFDKVAWRRDFDSGQWQDFRYGVFPHLPANVRNVFEALMSAPPARSGGNVPAAWNPSLNLPSIPQIPRWTPSPLPSIPAPPHWAPSPLPTVPAVPRWMPLRTAQQNAPSQNEALIKNLFQALMNPR